MHVHSMIATHPSVGADGDTALTAAIARCIDCAQTCVLCADACLAEEMVADLRQCIRLDLDCADACTAAARIGGRHTGSNPTVARLVLEACADACRMCGEECQRHAEMHEHCRICAETCRSCEQACRAAAKTVSTLQ